MEIRFTVLVLALYVTGFAPALALPQEGRPPEAHAKPAGKASQEAQEASDLDLEQLANMDVTVTSASKKVESLNHAPAAIYVLSGDVIRRGGSSARSSEST